jgi:putative flippase GtrA
MWIKLIEFARYVGASAIALTADYLVYWFLATRSIVTVSLASVFGYLFGMIVAYILIRDNVFNDGWLEDKKKLEFMLFLLSGLLGLALTYGSVRCVVYMIGERINLAKLVAVGVSFVGVYFFRKFVVFRNA